METNRKSKGAKAAKRPRSATPSKGGPSGSPSKKKSKKSKKSKDRSTNEASGASTSAKPTKSSLDETATADGQMMAQMLSTFTLLEQSRFEAYKRSSFSATAVQNWIAACLVHRLDCTTATAAAAIHGPQKRQLSDLVAWGTHTDIGIVVATAAKIYAQRLVAAAVQVAARPQQQQQQDGSSGMHQLQLQPLHVLTALHERQRNGLDPGFYLQPNEPYQWNASDHYAQRRLAALEAQEAYEKELNGDPKQQNENDNDKLQGNDAMQGVESSTTE